MCKKKEKNWCTKGKNNCVKKQKQKVTKKLKIGVKKCEKKFDVGRNTPPMKTNFDLTKIAVKSDGHFTKLLINLFKRVCPQTKFY